MFDVLIIGGGVSGMSSALMLGSARTQEYAKDKKIGILLHQRSSSLQNAIFNNVLGLKPNTTGASILKNGKKHLKEVYPHVSQIEFEKVLKIEKKLDYIIVYSNKNTYHSKNIIIAVGPKNFNIKGLEKYQELHAHIPPEKNRTQLKNNNYLVENGIYVTGVIAGLRSQFAIAVGSGTQVATDIMSLWNNGKPVKVHDSTILR
jgi:thioredoxin reductase